MVKAVIFDMDGVIFDSESVWKRAFLSANAYFNVNLSEEYRISTCGKGEYQIREDLKREHKELNADKYRDYLVNLANNNFESGNFEIKDGFIELVKLLKENDIKIGLATGGRKDRAYNMFKVKNLNMDNIFDAKTFGEDVVGKSKPNPYIFQYTASKLKVNPNECIVIEDSINGIEAAIKGGMIPIFAIDLIKPNDFVKKNAFKIINSLTELISKQKS